LLEELNEVLQVIRRRTVGGGLNLSLQSGSKVGEGLNAFARRVGRKQATAQVSALSCPLKGGVEFIALVVLEAGRCRLDFVTRRRPDDFARGGIERHHADFANYPIPGAGQVGWNDPDIDVPQDQAVGHTPTDPHPVVR
jgi:hypothetical protein